MLSKKCTDQIVDGSFGRGYQNEAYKNIIHQHIKNKQFDCACDYTVAHPVVESTGMEYHYNGDIYNPEDDYMHKAKVPKKIKTINLAIS